MSFRHKSSIKHLQFKLLVLGECSVGKTSLISRISTNTFKENYISTAGIDFIEKTFTTKENKQLKLQLWDTAGQERYRSIAKSLYNKADYILLLYSITEKNTYERITTWLKDIKTHLMDNVPVLLIGNKRDLEEFREVNEERGKEFARKNDISFFEASAKTGENCERILEYVIDELVNKVSNGGNAIKINNDKENDYDIGSFELEKNRIGNKCCK